MAHFNTCKISDSELLTRFNALRSHEYSSVLPFTEVKYYSNYTSNDNYQIRLFYHSSFADTELRSYRVGATLTTGTGGHACFVKVTWNETGETGSPTGNTFDHYLLLDNGVNINVRLNGANKYGTGYVYNNRVDWFSNDTIATSYNHVEYRDSQYNKWVAQGLNTGHSVYTKMSIIRSRVSRLYCTDIQNAYPLTQYYQPQIMSSCVFSFDSLPFPVFDISDTDAIINCLLTGSEEGSIDPFDPNNPPDIEVTDFNTNFDAYVTLGEPAQPYAGFTNIHWSVRALNEQYNEARDILAGRYSLDTVSTGYPWTYYKRTQAQVPVASFTKAIANNPDNNNTFQFFFTEYGTEDGTQNQHSGIFMIHYVYKEGSRSKCKISQVRFRSEPFTSNWQNEGVELSRVAIGTDAYKYTASTGETLTIYFRGITLDDLNKTDDGYKENPDTEASPTESDVSVVSGSGLSTFSITKAQFNLINKALWSTDWTQVFKTTTIDPIKCVITCKGIKFANAGSGDVPIIIANRDTDVSSGVVNPVKSYTIDNCYIPAINGDFTDISLMRVRCYLPYIGWVDLPSAEVVGRLAYNGVPAVNKRLTFKYIVDFIDGACRCVVSVNGTERWMFDGNCAVDIPVTSDNHTNAIGTAIKSGLATTLSIATGVAGAISGNAGAVAGGVVGAINSAPNMLPTYEYSASASPSGYINGSCNSHIMIVCEIPNVQIPNGFARKVGRPCERNLSLGSLVGYTQCKNVNVSGINATTEELTMIAQELNSGVYL